MFSFTCTQVNESDADDYDFGDYALDFIAGERCCHYFITIIP